MTAPQATSAPAPPVRSSSAGATRAWWLVVALLMLVVGLGHFNRVGMSVAGAEQIIPYGGMSETGLGQILSGFLLLYTLAMLPAGWLIDRFGPRAMLMAFCFGSALFVAATAAVGLFCETSASVWLGLLGVRSLMGIVNSPLHPAAARMVYAHVPARRLSLANGLVTFAALLGISATFYGFGSLIDAFDWPTAFLFTAGLTLVIGIIWTIGTRRVGGGANSSVLPADAALVEGTLGSEGASLSAFQHVFRNRGVLCLTASYAALGYFQYLFFYWIEYYFGTIEHLSKNAARGYTTAITLSMGIGMVAGGWLADRAAAQFGGRLGRSLVPAVAMAGSGLLFEAGLLTSSSEVMVVLFMLSAALLGMAEGAFWTTIVELGTPYGGFAAGLMNTGGNLGGALSPLATPALGKAFALWYGDSLGWRLSLAVAGAMSIVGALLWAGVGPPSRRENVPEDL